MPAGGNAPRPVTCYFETQNPQVATGSIKAPPTARNWHNRPHAGTLRQKLEPRRQP